MHPFDNIFKSVILQKDCKKQTKRNSMKNTVTAKHGMCSLFSLHSTELLVDCGWIHQHLECIEQEGFKCNQPVSDTAIINVPYRYTNRSGTYRCTPESSNNKDIKSCSCSESQLGQQSEAQVKKEKEKQEDTTQKNLDTNHSVPIGKPNFFVLVDRSD